MLSLFEYFCFAFERFSIEIPKIYESEKCSVLQMSRSIKDQELPNMPAAFLNAYFSRTKSQIVP